jgi:hypothetical protein
MPGAVKRRALEKSTTRRPLFGREEQPTSHAALTVAPAQGCACKPGKGQEDLIAFSEQQNLPQICV